MQRKGNKAPRERTLSRNNEQGGNWNVVNMTNETFNNYYKVRTLLQGPGSTHLHIRLTPPLTLQAQGIIPESEWDDFIKAFRQPLPTTFRLTSSRPCVLNPSLRPATTGVGAKLTDEATLSANLQDRASAEPAHQGRLCPVLDRARVRGHEPVSAQASRVVSLAPAY